MLGKIIGLIATILSVIGLISLYLSYVPTLNYVMKGDVANATDAAANATADNLVEEVKWTIVGTFVIAIASIFGLGAVAKRIFS
jgi:ABC-type Na+ efflux pump permease subunit